VESFDREVLPGEKGIIEASVATCPLWGSIDKSLDVFTDDNAHLKVTLNLRAALTPLFSVLPSPAVGSTTLVTRL
jgi:hypothetical protein